MTPPTEARPRKILSAPAVKARMSLLSVAVLLGGAFLAPAPVRSALSSPQEHAVPLLEEQVQTRVAAQPFRGVQDASLKVAAYSLAILERRAPSVTTTNDFLSLPPQAPVTGFAVRLSPTTAVTHVGALDGLSEVSIAMEDGTVEANVAAYDPTSGLTLLRLAQTELPWAPIAAAPVAPGSLVLASARLNRDNVTVPVFVTRADRQRYTFGAAPALLPGMPVYNLDGELIAIGATEPGGGFAVPVAGALDRLLARTGLQDEPGSFGLTLQDPDESLARVFGAAGPIVTEVAHGGPADAARLEAGDVLLAIGDLPCPTSAAAFAALSAVKPGEPATIRFDRAGRVRTVTAVAGNAYHVAASALAASTPGGPQAQSLLPRPTLEAAGIPPAAEVLLLNGRPATSTTQAAQELARARKPVPVLLRHHHRQFFVVLEAAQ